VPAHTVVNFSASAGRPRLTQSKLPQVGLDSQHSCNEHGKSRHAAELKGAGRGCVFGAVQGTPAQVAMASQHSACEQTAFGHRMVDGVAFGRPPDTTLAQLKDAQVGSASQQSPVAQAAPLAQTMVAKLTRLMLVPVLQMLGELLQRALLSQQSSSVQMLLAHRTVPSATRCVLSGHVIAAEAHVGSGRQHSVGWHAFVAQKVSAEFGIG
jgi:hypothetical protein